jgi:hypothetical protein
MLSMSCFEKWSLLINSGLFISTFLLFVVTGALVLVARKQLLLLNKQLKVNSDQLLSLNKQVGGDFLMRLNREFFKDFKHYIPLVEEKKPLFKPDGPFDEYDIDDYIGYFDLMQNLIDEKLLTFKLIDEVFGYYIARAWEHREIQNYVIQFREKMKDKSYYESFEILAKKIIAEEEKNKHR